MGLPFTSVMAGVKLAGNRRPVWSNQSFYNIMPFAVVVNLAEPEGYIWGFSLTE
jgi:hypothetical protein